MLGLAHYRDSDKDFIINEMPEEYREEMIQNILDLGVDQISHIQNILEDVKIRLLEEINREEEYEIASKIFEIENIAEPVLRELYKVLSRDKYLRKVYCFSEKSVNKAIDMILCRLIIQRTYENAEQEVFNKYLTEDKRNELVREATRRAEVVKSLTYSKDLIMDMGVVLSLLANLEVRDWSKLKESRLKLLAQYQIKKTKKVTVYNIKPEITDSNIPSVIGIDNKMLLISVSDEEDDYIRKNSSEIKKKAHKLFGINKVKTLRIKNVKDLIKFSEYFE